MDSYALKSLGFMQLKSLLTNTLEKHTVIAGSCFVKYIHLYWSLITDREVKLRMIFTFPAQVPSSCRRSVFRKPYFSLANLQLP